jgi:hypothetical protein
MHASRPLCPAELGEMGMGLSCAAVADMTVTKSQSFVPL